MKPPRDSAATDKKANIMDSYIFWTHNGNGWKWTVWKGAHCVAEGLCRSFDEAKKAADDYKAAA